jgi:hypothetical protein
VTINANRVLVIVALILAVVSPFVGTYPLLAIAVVLLAVAALL